MLRAEARLHCCSPVCAIRLPSATAFMLPRGRFMLRVCV